MSQNTVLIMASVRWYNASAHYALFLAESLKRSGTNVIIFGAPDSPIISRARSKGLDTIESIDVMNSGFFKYVFNFIAFRRFVRLRNINIINPHISRDHTFAFLSLLGKGKKIIRTRTDSIAPKKHIFNRIFYKIAAAGYIVSSKYMTRHLLEIGVGMNKISVIPLGINYKEFADYKPVRNIRSEFQIPKNKIIVSFIGRLDSVKGVQYFIRSFPYLKQKDKFYYLISGEEINQSKDELLELAGHLKITSLTIMNKAEDVRDILSQTDVGVIPSIASESICRIGLEMLSFGIPVVGSNINSIPELVTEFGGIIVNPRSSEQIASALDYLAIPSNYKKIKKKILKELRDQTRDRFALEHLEVFEKAIE